MENVDMEMDSATVLKVLLDEGVLDEADRHSYVLTDDFCHTVEQEESRLDDLSEEKLGAELEPTVDDEELVEFLVSSRAREEGITATYLAVADHLTGMDPSKRRGVVTLVDQLRGGPPRAEGAPDSFLPVSGDSIELLLELHSRAIVYVWKEDCEPCDVMREEFDDIFPAPDDDLALYAVYGPDWAELLSDQYGVVGAPTTLFVLEGSVDARLQGAHYRDVVENEIDILRSA